MSMIPPILVSVISHLFYPCSPTSVLLTQACDSYSSKHLGAFLETSFYYWLVDTSDASIVTDAHNSPCVVRVIAYRLP